MKRFVVLVVVVLLLMALAVPAFAHPNVPAQSIGKVNPSAVNGMHTAWGNVQGSDGIAAHVFMMRLSPHR
jgi:hypothetical protein